MNVSARDAADWITVKTSRATYARWQDLQPGKCGGAVEQDLLGERLSRDQPRHGKEGADRPPPQVHPPCIDRNTPNSLSDTRRPTISSIRSCPSKLVKTRNTAIGAEGMQDGRKGDGGRPSPGSPSSPPARHRECNSGRRRERPRQWIEQAQHPAHQPGHRRRGRR